MKVPRRPQFGWSGMPMVARDERQTCTDYSRFSRSVCNLASDIKESPRYKGSV
jgi:hypothetical protein